MTTPVPVSSLRKGGFVVIQGHPCQIADMTTTKMLSWTSGRPAATAHPNIRCDMCQQSIVHVRYACLDCPDYDLCETCEEQGATRHAAGAHVFAKVKNSQEVDVNKYRK
jgi:hypothetical protein